MKHAFAVIAFLICAATAQANENDDVRYLVIRRAGSPEKNYYELAKQVRLRSGDVITTEPDGIRYGVHSIWKVRVLRISDSQKDPESHKDGYYVLVYERTPDTRFCGKGYKVAGLPSGGRRIEYTDCEDKQPYSFMMTRQWPRPFLIYEVEVLNREVLGDLLKQEHSSGRSAGF